jgi:hypothetical protein
VRSAYRQNAEASVQGGQRCLADAVFALHTDDDDFAGASEQIPQLRADKAVGRALVDDRLMPGDIMDQLPARASGRIGIVLVA